LFAAHVFFAISWSWRQTMYHFYCPSSLLLVMSRSSPGSRFGAPLHDLIQFRLVRPSRHYAL
jgi:hypothetical protein